MSTTYTPIRTAYLEGRASEATTIAALSKYKMDGRHLMPEQTVLALVRQWKAKRKTQR